VQVYKIWSFRSSHNCNHASEEACVTPLRDM